MQYPDPQFSEASSRQSRRTPVPLARERFATSNQQDAENRSLHAIVSYVPVAGVLLALLADVLYFITGSNTWSVCSNILLGLGIVASVPAAMLGVVAMKSVERTPRSRKLATLHGIVSVVALLLISSGWASRLGGEPGMGTSLLIWSGIGIMIVAGLVGGEIPLTADADETVNEPETIGEVRHIQPIASQIDERTAANA